MSMHDVVEIRSNVLHPAVASSWRDALPYVLHRDYETRSQAIIKTAGTYKYATDLSTEVLESVRKHQAGLQSFRSMRRIEASRRNASALRLRFSQSLASLRQRLSQAKVRSTTQRRGSTTNPFVRSERLTISVSSCGKIFAKAF